MKRLVVFCFLILSISFYAPVAGAMVLTFNEGIDLWLSSSNSPDTGNPNLGWGRNLGANARNYDTLIKFTDIFGSAADQVPLGSTINSAELYMWIGYDRLKISHIYQMTFDWNAASTWLSIGSSGGIVPGVNAEASPEYSWTGTTDAWSQRIFNLTDSVQDWSDGADAFGWGFTRPRSGGTVSSMSLNYGTASYRPYLLVDFTPQEVVPEPASSALMAIGLAGTVAARFRRRK